MSKKTEHRVAAPEALYDRVAAIRQIGSGELTTVNMKSGGKATKRVSNPQGGRHAE
jgi:hypothetical protein